jgi:hypothetical protein
MPIKDVCSNNSSGMRPKPKPMPGSSENRGVKHAAVYEDYDGRQRNDQSTQQLPPTPPANLRSS